MKIPKFDDESNFPNLSSEELSEIRHLSVAYRIFMDIFLRSRFINGVFLCSMLIFITTYFLKLSDIRSPYGIPTSEFDLILIIPFSIVSGIIVTILYLTMNYKFDTVKWIHKYIQLWCKSFEFGIFIITFVVNLSILGIFFIVIQNSYFQGAEIAILFLFFVYIIFLIALLFGLLYIEPIKFHNEFFLYIKNNIINCTVYGDKIRAHSCLLFIYQLYGLEFNEFFGKESLNVIKLNNLLILSEEILKIDIYDDNLNTKKQDLLKSLSILEKNDPFHSTKNFINEMNNINSKFGHEGCIKRYEDIIPSKRNFLHRLKSKAYYILMILSIIIGFIRFISLTI